MARGITNILSNALGDSTHYNGRNLKLICQAFLPSNTSSEQEIEKFKAKEGLQINKCIFDTPHLMCGAWFPLGRLLTYTILPDDPANVSLESMELKLKKFLRLLGSWGLKNNSVSIYATYNQSVNDDNPTIRRYWGIVGFTATVKVKCTEGHEDVLPTTKDMTPEDPYAPIPQGEYLIRELVNDTYVVEENGFSYRVYHTIPIKNGAGEAPNQVTHKITSLEKLLPPDSERHIQRALLIRTVYV